MLTQEKLRQTLSRIDGKGYKAYRDILGSYNFTTYTLHIDHVQGDPFASPSKVRVRVPLSEVRLPQALFENGKRRLGLEDYLARQIRQSIRRIVRGPRGMGKSGLIAIDAGGQEVLQRTALIITEEWVEARLQIGLPARGRTILGGQATNMLCKELPQIVESSMYWENIPHREVQEFVECVENQEYIRAQLDVMGLVAFVADGSILPRESGASDHPMLITRAVAFQSPHSL